MSLTLRDLEDANLAGTVAFERWRMEWEAEFIAPLGDEAVGEMIESMAPVQRELLKGQNPEAWKSLEKRTKAR